MSQIRIRNISYSHGGPPLVTAGNAVINQGDRVAIIGRNGAGKSTLLNLFIDDSTLDEGVIEKQAHCQVAMLDQTIPEDIDATVYEVVKSGINQSTVEPWDVHHRVEAVLSQLQLKGESYFPSLSGGLKRQVLLAKSIVATPDVLLLDEPTNHLDISAILRLEKFLSNYDKTVIFISHDRNLMQAVSTKIINIDNGQLISWSGHYHAFMRHKEALYAAEEKANALFDKRLSQEEVWIRQGIKARRTRNEGRVRALEKMREEYSARRKRIGTAQFSEQIMQASGKQVFEINNASFSYADKTIIKSFSSIIVRGEKIGIIGDNGSGKSTLINLLLGNIQPTSGTVKQGSNLEIAYFDQRHQALELNKTLAENVSSGSEIVTIGTQNKHVISYLQDFLFSPEAARSPVKNLSGGERNRALLAKLFLIPSNVLILDEPTNDLDIETLELLEEKLSEYKGTLLLVSHDREFLNNLVTRTYVLPGDGSVQKYNGGYDDYLRQHDVVKCDKPVKHANTAVKMTGGLVHEARQKTKELEKIMKQIERLEQEQADLYAKMAEPNFYQQSTECVEKLQKQTKMTEAKLAAAYARWEELEGGS
jgi:ATP-binding cassette subfamily F protein uup